MREEMLALFVLYYIDSWKAILVTRKHAGKLRDDLLIVSRGLDSLHKVKKVSPSFIFPRFRYPKEIDANRPAN